MDVPSPSQIGMPGTNADDNTDLGNMGPEYELKFAAAANNTTIANSDQDINFLDNLSATGDHNVNMEGIQKS